MKLKLTNSELFALCRLVEAVMLSMQKKRSENKMDMQDKLDLALTERTWLTLYKKQLDMKQKYNVSLSAELALNFFIQFNDQTIPDVYVQNLVRQVCDKIHQQYA